jgi:N-acetylglucosamine malate deacetylase 1
MNNMNKILIVAAHPDDEVLGAGGTILKHARAGDSVYLLLLGDGVTSRGADKTEIKARRNQAWRVAKRLGIKKVFFETLPDNKFDSVSLLDITKSVEKAVYSLKPNLVYTHFGEDLNIDHRLTFQAVMTACRPQPKFFVKKILAFEALSSTEWQAKKKNKTFCPNEYNDIGEFIDEKIKAMEIYKDELKEYPHPRSKKGIKILAQYRGLEVGYKYAEAFQIIRNLKD